MSRGEERGKRSTGTTGCGAGNSSSAESYDKEADEIDSLQHQRRGYSTLEVVKR